MKLSDCLEGSTKKLKHAGIGTARLDALVLLEDITSKDRAWLLAHPELELSSIQLRDLEKQIQRRIKHEPLAYIRGKTEFYGREFIINKAVLEPRPESETMIELLKTIKLPATPLIADIGTGSGALAITAKLELPKSEVIATDIDKNCLDVARTNIKNLKAEIKIFQGNLLEPLSTTNYKLPTAILANLPYVPSNYKINQAAAMEPRIAIFGGEDGLDLYRQLFDQLNRGETRVQYVLTESLPFQHSGLEHIAKQAGYKLQKTEDFIQIFVN